VGQLALVVAALACVPLAVAYRDGEMEMATRYAIVSGLLAVAGGLAAHMRGPRRIRTNEALVVAAATVEDKPRAFVFARAWMQWYGGLGIVVLSIALVVKPGILARRLAVTESVEEDLVGGMRAHARRALVTYSLLTLGGAALLWTLGAGGFEALSYSLASVSTGGYAPHDDSVAGLGGFPVQLVVTGLCVLGALSLTFYRRVPRAGLREALRDTQLRMLLLLGGAAAVGVTASMIVLGGASPGEALRHGPLLAFSAQSTAGFASADVAELDGFSKVILALSMAVGGGAGSTAGGLKLLRLLVLVRVLRGFLRWTALPPHAVSEPRIGGHVITPSEVRDALMIAALFAALVLLSWLAFLWEGHEGIDSLFEVVSASGTVGLSTGITGPELSTPLKLVLCVDMLMGRLEMIPLLVLLYPGTWSGAMRRKP
jgi:trk system potassium uptake protein TrkH